MSRIAAILLLVFCPGLGARAQSSGAEKSAGTAPPSLIVLVTIDQFRGDYLDRFGPQLHGGLGRLMRSGAWFTNAHQDHAITETAPGHASLLSGRFPRSTGITSNDVGVGDASAPLVEIPNADGASPARFQGTTLVDWLRGKDARSRTLSVSMKDRAAILPVGRSRADVYWYYPDGRFTTSRYYRDSLPQWVARFNARKLPQSFAGKSWTPLLSDSAYKEPDSVNVEGAGIEYAFPHRLPDDGDAVASLVRLTPWMDDITLAFALEGMRERSLGDGPATDVLAVSLSATDVIGHRYGPDSKEIHDQVLRLDRSLGIFLDSLFKLRDSSRVAIALVSDHGVGTIPELAARNVRPMPERVDLSQPAANMRARLVAGHVEPTATYLDNKTVRVDRAALGNARINIDTVLAAFAREAKQIPGVRRVDRFLDILAGDTVNDAIARRWSHQFPKGGDVALVITLTPSSTSGGSVATHGSPYDYDTHVPLIFYGMAFRAGRYSGFVRTVDLAPTLAEVAGVKAGERLDGVVLTQALKRGKTPHRPPR